MAETVTPIDDARRARARSAIAAAAVEALAAAREARDVVARRMRPTSPGRRRIIAAVAAFEGAIARGQLGDDRPTAAERAWAAEALRAAQRVRDELRRTSAELARASRRRDRSVLERALDAPGDVAATAAAELGRQLGALADRIERSVTTVATSATEAWGGTASTIGLAGVLVLGVVIWALFRK